MKILLKKDPRYHLKPARVRQLVRQILAPWSGLEKAELSISFVGRRQARALNQRWRQMDYIPLVLSFSQEGARAGGRRLLGDLVICWPEVREQAIRENASLDEVLENLLRHGLKNLLADWQP